MRKSSKKQNAQRRITHFSHYYAGALVSVKPGTDPRPARSYQLYKELPKDPWQTAYIYRNPWLKSLSAYDLFSANPDRKPDIEDDD